MRIARPAEHIDRLAPGQRLAWVFLIYGMISTGLLALLMPPFQNADEPNHMLRADQVGRGGLLATRFAGNTNSGGRASPGILLATQDFDALKSHPDARVTEAMLMAGASRPWGTPAMTGFANTAIYPPWFYAPAALAIRIGRHAGWTVPRTLTLARLANAVVSVSLSAAAIGLAGSGAPWLFAVLCLPMSCAVMAAVSQDGPMLACAALAAALLRRGLASGRPPFAWWFVTMCGLLAAVIAARPPYLPLALLPLILSRPGGRARLVGAACTAAAALGWVALAGWAAELKAVATHGGSLPGQVRLLALHPWRIATIARQTFIDHGMFYRDSFIGCLGWLDVVLPAAYLTATTAMLVVAVPASLSEPRAVSPRAGGLIVLMGAAAAALVFLAQYLTWTTLGAASVDGVQGRYFLPLAVFLLPAMGALPRMTRLARLSAFVVVAFPVLTILVVVQVLVLRYTLS